MIVFTIIISVLLILISRTTFFKLLLLVGVGILFNPITMLIIVLLYESTKRGIK